MKIFAISDLHLSINNQKPMDIFGPVWDNYLDKIIEDWNKKVSENDIVLLCGDLSWAMKLEDAVLDLKILEKLKGKKILLKGNHDYWWSSISKVRSILPKNIYAIQNDCLVFDNFIFCGSRGWTVDKNKMKEADKKIFDRELIRLEISLKSAKLKQNNNEKIICLMHFPPFDKFYKTTEFTNLIEKYGVDLVVYGHLHGKKLNIQKQIVINNIRYILSSCDMVNNELVEIF